VEAKSGLLIIDNSIKEKLYTDENEHICWHYGHSIDRQVKGIDFISLLYHSQGVWLPIGFVLAQNQVEFSCVLNDIWYAAAENMNFIKQENCSKILLCHSKAIVRLCVVC
jgi:hypothetical protein